MQKIISAAAMLLLTGLLAAAQSSSPQSPPNDQQQRGSISQAMDEQQNSSMTGCIRVAGGTYWLNDEQGHTYRLSGKTDSLARLAGHKVQIAGNRGTDDKTITVTSASNLGSSCTASMGASSGVRQNGGVAAPSDPYQATPEQQQRDRDLPNPQLNHPRPEDQTPSVGAAGQPRANASGTATGTQSNTSGHKKHHRKRHPKDSTDHNGDTSTRSIPPTQH